MLKTNITDAVEYERQLLENVLCDDDENAAISRRLLDIFYSCDEKTLDHVIPTKSYNDQTTE